MPTTLALHKTATTAAGVRGPRAERDAKRRDERRGVPTDLRRRYRPARREPDERHGVAANLRHPATTPPREQRGAKALNATSRPKAARLTLNRRRPTLPGPCEPSTIGAERLNFSVRNGKRCFPLAKATGNLREIPAAPQNRTAHHMGNSRRQLVNKNRQALEPLVPVSFARYRTSRSGLSTWWSTRGLTPSMGMGELILRLASRLDAFSGYPIRT